MSEPTSTQTPGGGGGPGASFKSSFLSRQEEDEEKVIMHGGELVGGVARVCAEVVGVRTGEGVNFLECDLQLPRTPPLLILNGRGNPYHSNSRRKF